MMGLFGGSDGVAVHVCYPKRMRKRFVNRFKRVEALKAIYSLSVDKTVQVFGD
jgi:hypothetical protein